MKSVFLVVNPSELQEALATQRLVWEKVDVIVEKTKGFKDKEPFEDLGRLRELNIMTNILFNARNV